MALITPDLTPIAYDAGPELRLFEANGWAKDNPDLCRRHRITLQRFSGQDSDYWAVEYDGTYLVRIDEDLLVFGYKGPGLEKRDTATEALCLLVKYLIQPTNPYIWIRENAD